MSRRDQPSLDRHIELACDRALIGLSPAEEAELVSLMTSGQQVDPGLEVAAAAIALAESEAEEPLPQHLAERVLASANAQPAAPPLRVVRGGTVPMLPQQPLLPPRAVTPPPRIEQPQPVAPARPSVLRRFAPWLAAAACFGIAVGSFVFRGPRDEQALGTGDPRAGAADRRARLLSEAPDAVRVAWSSTKDPAGQGESGDIVWSSARQEGFMTFRALASNDPSKYQYQLWIFDGARDERYPVDGGVFDVDPSKGEVVIPITARVRVSDPRLFAVTIEPPGGVVVSSRERIVVTAKVSG